MLIGIEREDIDSLLLRLMSIVDSLEASSLLIRQIIHPDGSIAVARTLLDPVMNGLIASTANVLFDNQHRLVKLVSDGSDTGMLNHRRLLALAFIRLRLINVNYSVLPSVSRPLKFISAVFTHSLEVVISHDLVQSLIVILNTLPQFISGMSMVDR
jgi:hypothetical protein